MAKILPEDNDLQVIYEGNDFSVEFTEELESDETLVDIYISADDLPDSIYVNGNIFSGNFRGLFRLPEHSLKYRLGDDLLSTDSFSELPPKGTADLYSYSAPREMLNTYTITVTLVYDKGAEGSTPETLNISKVYKQQVRGTWDTFLNMFLNYVR